VILDTDDNPPLASALSWFVAIVVSPIALAVQAVLCIGSPAAGDAPASK
jgi:hypothetical protein